LQPSDRVDASLVSHNILDERHPEFGTVLYHVPTEDEHAVFFKVTLRF
jgi:hypothetical protein